MNTVLLAGLAAFDLVIWSHNLVMLYRVLV